MADKRSTHKGRWILGIAIGLVLFVCYAWLGPRKGDSIRIGYQPNVIYLPVFVAQERGYFKDEGLNVALQEFKSADEMMLMLKTGNIHITGMSSLEVVARSEEANPGTLKLLTLEEFSPSDSPDAIVVRKDAGIKRFADLKGKTLGTWKGSTIRTYTKIILQSENIAVQNVTIVDLGKEELVQLLKLGKLDAAFTFEPSVTELTLSGQGEILERGPLSKRLLGQPKNIYPGGSAVLSDFAKKNPKIVEKFQRAYQRAVDDIRKDWQGSVKVLASYSTIDANIITNMSHMNWVSASKGHVSSVQELLDLYTNHGITESKVDAQSLLLDRR